MTPFPMAVARAPQQRCCFGRCRFWCWHCCRPWLRQQMARQGWQGCPRQHSAGCTRQFAWQGFPPLCGRSSRSGGGGVGSSSSNGSVAHQVMQGAGSSLAILVAVCMVHPSKRPKPQAQNSDKAQRARRHLPGPMSRSKASRVIVRLLTWVTATQSACRGFLVSSATSPNTSPVPSDLVSFLSPYTTEERHDQWLEMPGGSHAREAMPEASYASQQLASKAR